MLRNIFRQIYKKCGCGLSDDDAKRLAASHAGNYVKLHGKHKSGYSLYLDTLAHNSTLTEQDYHTRIFAAPALFRAIVGLRSADLAWGTYVAQGGRHHNLPSKAKVAAVYAAVQLSEDWHHLTLNRVPTPGAPSAESLSVAELDCDGKALEGCLRWEVGQMGELARGRPERVSTRLALPDAVMTPLRRVAFPEATSQAHKAAFSNSTHGIQAGLRALEGHGVALVEALLAARRATCEDLSLCGCMTTT